MTHLAAMCVALGVTLGSATTALGQQYPPPIRPTHPTNAEAPAPPNFDSAENAWDENPFSGSGNVIVNLCKVQCLAPVTRQTEWYGFPGGWIPRSLVVAWDYASDFFSANGVVEAKIEYSLDGGQQWTTLQHIVRTTKETINTTETAVTLSPEQDATLVRVRAFLQIRITQCGMQCSWLDWGQVGGRLYIRDIRIEVACPVPEDEEVTSLGWDDVLTHLHSFDQRLLSYPGAPDASFAGRTVRERGVNGTNTCYFEGSAYPEEVFLSNSTWPVEADNTWGPDGIALLQADEITYYRTERPARNLPDACELSITQVMSILGCSDTDVDYAQHPIRNMMDSLYLGVQKDWFVTWRLWP